MKIEKKNAGVDVTSRDRAAPRSNTCDRRPSSTPLGPRSHTVCRRSATLSRSDRGRAGRGRMRPQGRQAPHGGGTRPRARAGAAGRAPAGTSKGVKISLMRGVSSVSKQAPPPGVRSQPPQRGPRLLIARVLGADGGRRGMARSRDALTGRKPSVGVSRPRRRARRASPRPPSCLRAGRGASDAARPCVIGSTARPRKRPSRRRCPERAFGGNKPEVHSADRPTVRQSLTGARPPMGLPIDAL